MQVQQGDILHADAEALVNTVNCVGIMGRGIALQFRKEFPENYKDYKAACDRKELQPCKMLVFDLNRLQHPRFIINFPTKRHWKNRSRIEDIQAGLAALVEEVRRLRVQSIAVPPLGQVADLIDGFETPFGLELLATVGLDHRFGLGVASSSGMAVELIRTRPRCATAAICPSGPDSY